MNETPAVSDRGVYIAPPSGTFIGNNIQVSITGNAIHNMYFPISVDDTDGCTVANNTILQDDVTISAGQGITTTTSTTDVVITGNTIDRIGSFGIRALGLRTIVDNNVVIGAAATTSIGTTAGNGTIVGHNIVDTQSTAASTGVVVAAAAADMSIPYASKGSMLIELTGATTINTITFNIANNYNTMFNILSHGAGNTIAHNGAGTGVGITPVTTP